MDCAPLGERGPPAKDASSAKNASRKPRAFGLDPPPSRPAYVDVGRKLGNGAGFAVLSRWSYRGAKRRRLEAGETLMKTLTAVLVAVAALTAVASPASAYPWRHHHWRHWHPHWHHWHHHWR
jgi:hypothetical protein